MIKSTMIGMRVIVSLPIIVFAAAHIISVAEEAKWGLGKLAPLVFARYLITFFIGVAATLAWQSYRDATREEMIGATPASLDLVRQSVDKLAVEITKLQAAEQDILDRISTPMPRPAAASAHNPVLRPSQTSPSR